MQLLDTSGLRAPGSSRSNRLHDKASFQLMKNHDLPYIKQLLADDYQEELCQSYELFEYLAQEQNFTFEFIELPTISEGKSILHLVVIALSLLHQIPFNYYSKFVSILFLSFMVAEEHSIPLVPIPSI